MLRAHYDIVPGCKRHFLADDVGMYQYRTAVVGWMLPLRTPRPAAQRSPRRAFSDLVASMWQLLSLFLLTPVRYLVPGSKTRESARHPIVTLLVQVLSVCVRCGSRIRLLLLILVPLPYPRGSASFLVNLVGLSVLRCRSTSKLLRCSLSPSRTYEALPHSNREHMQATCRTRYLV